MLGLTAGHWQKNSERVDLRVARAPLLFTLLHFLPEEYFVDPGTAEDH
jgi:hypothetical protein